MKLLRILKLKILSKLLNLDDNSRTTEEEEKTWLYNSHQDAGFRSYCRFRNLQIMKQIANDVHKKNFYDAVESNGRRLELLHLQVKAQTESRKFKI